MNISLDDDKLSEPHGAVDGATLLLHAERVEIGRRRVETGTITVSVQTSERVHDVPVDLAIETVAVRHVPINRPVDVAPAIRHEGDTMIIPIMEEVLVIEKRLMLKEEIHITRISGIRTETQAITLREQSAIITRSPVPDGNLPVASGVTPLTPQQDA